MLYNRKKWILLIIIYLGFISLGLPDGILGVAWPAMRNDLNLPLENIGIITSLLLCMSAFSSVVSNRILGKYGTGGITFVSALMTGTALLGYSIAPAFGWLVLLTVPLGLGQGAVDSGLNLYVAENYSARHMNWLHCFWGVGATMGPFLMTQAISGGNGWQSGYRLIAVIQLSLTAILLVSLAVGLWKVEKPVTSATEAAETEASDSGLYKSSAQVLAVLLFFLYSGIEFTVGVWTNSVLVESRQISVTLAGFAVTAFYASIMIGRLLSGIFVDRIGNQRMIRIGLILALAGSICAGFSREYAGTLLGVIAVGLGCAPTYPCLMHITPIRFRKAVSDRLIGYQVGAACLGGTVITSGAGPIFSRVSLELVFPVVAVLLVVAYVSNEILQRGYLRAVKETA